MSEQQPEALRLAGDLEDFYDLLAQSAAELRRLHAEVERLRQRLEVAPHGMDGIYTRDETIRLLEAEVERLKEQAEQAQPVQEPVAWRITDGEGDYEYCTELPDEWSIEWSARYGRKYEPLYTAPPQRQPLTDEDIMGVCRAEWASHPLEIARAVERAHEIGGDV